MRVRLATTATVIVIVTAAACSSDDADTLPDEPVTILDLTQFDDIDPGDVISLRDDGAGGVEWIERRSGRIVGLPEIDRHFADPASPDDVVEIATIDVVGSGDEPPGEQRGLVGQTVLDGVRYIAWTDPDTTELFVGEVEDPANEPRVVWAGGATAGGAVGGQLQPSPDGRLLLGIGQLTDWAQANDSGAMVTLDPAGPPDQEPTIVSDGYINPFAFGVGSAEDGSTVWVADNAVGEDVERIGRGDLANRDEHPPTGGDPRAPASLIVLDDGRLAICGFLDNELQLWDVGLDTPTFVETIGPCLTSVAEVRVDDDTSVLVTASLDALVAMPLPES